MTDGFTTKDSRSNQTMRRVLTTKSAKIEKEMEGGFSNPPWTTWNNLPGRETFEAQQCKDHKGNLGRGKIHEDRRHR
jgi:hypothetical protein